MPYTSHGHPYGLVLIGDTPPRLIAKCGGPAICGTCSTEAHSSSPLDADSAAALVALGWTPPAPPAELTEAQRLAEGIICELVSEAEFGDIGDRLEDHAEGLAAIEFDQLRRNVADLISKATITVTWPQDAEQAGGDA